MQVTYKIFPGKYIPAPIGSTLEKQAFEVVFFLLNENIQDNAPHAVVLSSKQIGWKFNPHFILANTRKS